MKITVNALTLEGTPVRVTLDDSSARHIIRRGEDVAYADLSVTDQNRADTLLDSLSDQPIYHDGRVWGSHPDVTSLNVWEPAELLDDGDETGDDYILTHTPRQIAQENSLEDIERWSHLVVDEFSDVDGIFGSEVTPYDLADDIVDIKACVDTINDWYSDVPEDERPSPRDLKYAYHIFSALSIKLAEEDEDDDEGDDDE